MYSVCIPIYKSLYLDSYPSTHGISGLATGGAWEQFRVYLEMTIEWTQRYPWRPLSWELRAALGGRDRGSLEMHLEHMNVQTSRPWLSEFSDPLGGGDRVPQECTWRQWLTELGDALGGHNRASWGCTWRAWLIQIGGILGHGWAGGGRLGGRSDGSWDFIRWFTLNWGNVESWVQQGVRRDERWDDERLAWCRTQSILGWWSIQCLLYSVLTYDHSMLR